MQHPNADALGGGGDEQVGVTDRTVVQAAAMGELLVDCQRTSPLVDTNRTARQSVQLASKTRELAGATGAVQELKPHNVAGRQPPVDEFFIEGGAQLTAGRAGPDPSARVSQLHLREPARAADFFQHIRGEVSEIALRELFASGTLDDRTQRRVDRVRGSCCPEHSGRRVDEVRVQVDVRAPDLGLAHLANDTPLRGRTIHIAQLREQGDAFSTRTTSAAGWDHDIVLEKRAIPTQERSFRPASLATSLPPEDSGGPWGYADLKDTLADPRHEDHDHMLDWLGLERAEEFDPAACDLAEINEVLDVTVAARR